jgi:hypothetical protein
MRRRARRARDGQAPHRLLRERARHDTLEVEVEAWVAPGARNRLLLHHRIRRSADGRLIAVSSVEKTLPACAA